MQLYQLFKSAAVDAQTVVLIKASIVSAGLAGGVAVLEQQNWLAIIAAATAIVTLLAGVFKIMESVVRIWIDLRKHAREEYQARLDARRREMLDLARVRKPKGK